jgi:hypothetical protein
MKLDIREVKDELKQEFSFISGHDMVRLYDYAFKTDFARKINKESVDRNEKLQTKIKMFISKILEHSEPSDLVDIYNFWKFGKKDTKSLFENLDRILVEQQTKFLKAVESLVKKLESKFDIQWNCDETGRTFSVEIIEDGNFSDIVEYIHDEFLDKEFNVNGDWKMIGNHGNILILSYTPEITADIEEPQSPSNKIEYDSERETTKKVGEWNGKND